MAAFVPGSPSARPTDHKDEALLAFTEEAGTPSLLVWFGFGAVMLVPGLEDLTWRDVVFAVLALTVLRMVPVALALAGSGLDGVTVAFIGWFGLAGWRRWCSASSPSTRSNRRSPRSCWPPSP